MDLFIAVYFDDIHSLNRWVGNLWPAGWIRPVRPFHPAREAIPSRQLRQPQACTRFSEIPLGVTCVAEVFLTGRHLHCLCPFHEGKPEKGCNRAAGSIKYE
ncbi:hypothetical protein M513_05143 [Trichuris suis]|uniref:Uncharacterized protein n=1 Tax=Trichuris suis TaxID=68888 RepID=A0A085M9I0_9BILA|nr:hypothetical protein M513_05143 [Trichuris suis]